MGYHREMMNTHTEVAPGPGYERGERTDDLIRRLRRIEGQVRGLQKMVDEERYCADVLMQITSVQEALRGVGRTLLHNHLRYCATEAIRSGDRDQAEDMYQEIVDLFYKSAR